MPGRNPLFAARLGLGAALILPRVDDSPGSCLACAMDALGFDSGIPRTLARPPRMRGPDWLLLAATGALGVAAMAVSVAVGSWTFIFV